MDKFLWIAMEADQTPQIWPTSPPHRLDIDRCIQVTVSLYSKDEVLLEGDEEDDEEDEGVEQEEEEEEEGDEGEDDEPDEEQTPAD